MNASVPSQPSNARLRMSRRAALFAVFALGGLTGALAVGWVQHRLQAEHSAEVAVQPGNWVQRAAVAHAVFVPEQRHPVEVSVGGASAEDNRAQEDHLVRWLTRRLGFAVKLFDMNDQGFELLGGRLLPDAPVPGAQLMYQSREAGPGGTASPRVTVTLYRPGGSTDFAFRYEHQGELGLFYGVQGGVGCVLAGNLPREQLQALADSVRRQSAAAK